MAEVDESQFSIMSLEDELTCSICLSTFDCPVTIPCGHNFCQDCLLATWKESYSCPQCRTLFATRPELKKNTVLTAVVETFKVRSSKSEPNLAAEESQVKKKEIIRCDSCMEAEASKTCLTCMASYCEEHLRPHRENPIFRLHSLSEPVGDLLDRICPDHHKLMELFCSQHDRPICSFCLQQVHKGCSFTTPDEQRSRKESDLRSKLGLLDGKIVKNETIIFEMKDMQNKLKDLATSRKRALTAEYQQMREMLVQDERDALNAVDREVETGQTKLRVLMKKFGDNIDNMTKAKEEIHSLLSRSQTQAFLQAPFNLPQAINFEPYSPKISLDSKKVLASQAFAAALKQHLTELFKQPVESRLPLNTPGEWQTKDHRCCYSHIFEVHASLLFKSLSLKSDICTFNFINTSLVFLEPKPKNPQTTGDGMGDKTTDRSMENLLEFGGKPRGPGVFSSCGNSRCGSYEISVFLSLPDGTVLTFNPRTAHKRIALTENFTKASVSDEHINYPDCPERFAVCSQVLASKGFSTGRHYWEVRLSSSNFVGIGLAYNSIDRKGPTSRLGRNAQSWCVEWFNVKLSVWHNSSETVLVNPNPKRVGVLLDCEAGTATFYNVADRAYPFHSFMFPFAQAVYPAFWIFSSGSSITLCKLQ
uniref:Tripartite motif containing 25 n=1 Tax=Oreochromis aureus TaxID=47969 RepID=A0A668SZP8_OREAU